MTSPKALGTKRVVREERALRVRRMYAEMGSIYAPTENRRNGFQQPIITIENPPPGLNCAKLKKLVESKLGTMSPEIVEITIRNALMRACDPKIDYPPYESDPVELVLHALGLTQPKPKRTGRNGGRSKG